MPSNGARISVNSRFNCRVGHRRLVRGHGAGQRVHARLARVEFILRNQFLIEQFLLAVELDFRVFQLRLVARQRRLRRCQRRLRRARVNREQQVALFDLLAFLEMHLLQNAADLRADRHR